VHKCVIFAVGDDELEEGVDRLAIVIERQISYFADGDGLEVFLYQFRDSPWGEVFRIMASDFNKDNPRTPFSMWTGVDESFRDLICAMTNFDPPKRITAREALEHKWFVTAREALEHKWFDGV
jgi:serine/threonine protein kinase